MFDEFFEDAMFVLLALLEDSPQERRLVHRSRLRSCAA